MLNQTDTTAIAQQFHEEGFSIVRDLATPETIAKIGEIYDGMLDGSIPCAQTDRQLGGITRQIMMPHAYHPFLVENQAFQTARELAKSLVGTDDPKMRYSMMIYKPPGHPHETPWHQDMAYAGRPTLAAGTLWPYHAFAQFWLAIDDVDKTMGCMEFIPRFHTLPMAEHIVASGDPDDVGRLLGVRDTASLDLSRAVQCPLQAGSATIHSYATPHFTAPNRHPTRGRRAFIFNFSNQETVDALGIPASVSGQLADQD